jgi:hypothetical protein
MNIDTGVRNDKVFLAQSASGLNQALTFALKHAHSSTRLAAGTPSCRVSRTLENISKVQTKPSVRVLLINE